MTKVTFYKSNGVYYAFEETGHTGYGESGDDVLCAALSAMTMLVINAIEVGYSSHVDYSIGDDTATVVLTAKGALLDYEKDAAKRYAVSGLILAYYHQLKELAEEYYDNLSVEVVEKKPE